MKTDMQAMVIHHYGKGPVSLERMPLPSMSPYEVRVKIKAASINPIDFKIRDGGLKMLLTYQFPLILGNDFADEVYEVGDKVTQFKVGDKVYGRPRKSKIGTFAEYISVNAEEIAPMPKGLSYEEAASIPLVGLTAYQAINEVIQAQPGDKVLIQAGSGGVGSFAIQYAKAKGLYVATTGSDSGKELIESLNPDEFINYKEQDFSEVLKDFDGVFDTLGGENLEKSFQILKPQGIIASISGLPTERNARKLDKSIFKRGILKAASYKYQRLAKKYDVQYEFLFMHPSGQQLREITELIEVGKIKPIIGKVYDFKETQKALEYSESGRAKGKIIVKMEDE
ncbi:MULTISPECIES: NADP-dependent oxidoreductase [Staphylococcus]|uniref:NADP-dependent oxidoreductase n=1 Tax=Staphylococcus TaxID=1279 RepID=UPI0001EF491B|nr:NADP-dependent oxidoreductase [Staphylococcus capitis]EFS16463.1 oxidoreductase, zinc-binding [Staphylococcus capitis C87]MDS3991150.1 NADP-dependent oxidoreductase [Staphylococcus capitis]MDS4000409.1 NADP-dependent oxidoreductase [Staphylococcus capitis]UZX46975.1 NADP-dependent oxidoreductase [Staphylococcus capitis]